MGPPGDIALCRRTSSRANQAMAAQPGRPDGYCTGCVHTLAHWPCTVARIALSAVAGHN